MRKESLLSLFGRHLTRNIYLKRSCRDDIPSPDMIEVLSFAIAERLPLSYYRKHAHEGIIRSAYVVKECLRSLYRMGAVTAKFIRGLKRSLRMAKRAIVTLLRSRKRNQVTAITSTARAIGSSLLFKSFLLIDRRLQFVFARNRIDMEPGKLYFIHLIPSDLSSVSEDIQAKGFISFDGWPHVPFEFWEQHRDYVHEVDVGTLPPGYYRLKIGVYHSRTFIRDKVIGSADNAIDLGWIRLL